VTEPIIPPCALLGVVSAFLNMIILDVYLSSILLKFLSDCIEGFH